MNIREYNRNDPSHKAKIVKTILAMPNTTVRLRGRDYSHTEENALIYGQDYMESSLEFESNKEIWRIYQSGQFVHHIAMREDWQQEDNMIFDGKSEAFGV